MYSNIVKILNQERDVFGTGIIISNNEVLTAAHVVRDEDTVEIELEKKFVGKVGYVDDIVAIIYVESEEFKEKYSFLCDKLSFSEIELFDESSKWEVEGYITENLVKHRMEGIGIYAIDDHVAEYTLDIIKSGFLNSYVGLSGSPVIVNGRIIGIIQIQSWNQKGELGISFSSIARFANKLPNNVICEPLYVSELRQTCHEKCNSLISKNKEITKYIPEIFVEEGQYKENLRYFSFPILFINKIINELRNIDFNNLNLVLKREKKREINFKDFPENVTADNYENVYDSIIVLLKRIILDIEKIDERRSGGNSIEETYKEVFFLNSSIKWDINNILSQMEYLKMRVILLTRNAGQGKTNFVCDFTEKFLIKREIISLFFNAADFCDTPVNVLTRHITLSGKYGEKYSVKILNELWKKTRIPVVVIIDGLNENISLPSFENHILQAVIEWLKLPFLKIIMTTRCELLQERFGKLTKDNIGEDFSVINMPCWREDKFKKRIFEGYLKHFDVNIIRDSLNSSTYDLLSNDTLLLRFFCEMNRGKKQVYMYNVYKYTLFDSYYKNKNKEIRETKVLGGDLLFERLVNNICSYMVKNKIFNNIPKDAIDLNLVQLLDNIVEGDIVFKEDQLVKKGFVNKSIEVLSFTFDEFRDFCITRYLLSCDDAIKSFPLVWNEMCRDNWIILDGVEKYLFFLARTSVPEILPIIEKNSNFSNMYWDNIWDLEDKDITYQDFYVWRKQFDNKGPHRRRLIKYLLGRRDKEYFKNVSIDLLFEIMDKISDNPGEFDVFIKTFFPISKVDRYNKRIYQKDCVFNCNKMVEAISLGMEEKNNKLDYYTYLKMSIYLYGIIPNVYLYGIIPNDIKNLWIKALQYCLNIIRTITNEYLKKEYISIVLKTNLADLYQALDELMEDDEIRDLKERCDNIDMYQETLSYLKKIWL